MTDLNALILQHMGVKTPSFAATSRYFGLDLGILETQGARPVVYVRRRFIPPPEQYHVLQEHFVAESERPDTVAAQYLGDPEQFWRICDANAVMHPNELTETIRASIKITLPAGIPGPNNA